MIALSQSASTCYTCQNKVKLIASAAFCNAETVNFHLYLPLLCPQNLHQTKISAELKYCVGLVKYDMPALLLLEVFTKMDSFLALVYL